MSNSVPRMCSTPLLVWFSASFLLEGYVPVGQALQWSSAQWASRYHASCSPLYHKYGQFWCLGFVINIFMNCFTHTPINFIISRWFIDKSGLGHIDSICRRRGRRRSFSKAICDHVATHGWRYCYRFTGVLALVVVLLLHLLSVRIRVKGLQPLHKIDSDEAGGADAQAQMLVGLTKSEALKTVFFLLLCCCGSYDRYDGCRHYDACSNFPH